MLLFFKWWGENVFPSLFDSHSIRQLLATLGISTNQCLHLNVVTIRELLYRFRGNVLLKEKRESEGYESFFFSREREFRDIQLRGVRGACFKIKLAGSVLSKNTPPLLVAFYFID